MHSSNLIYPGYDLFDYHLATLPPNFKQCFEQDQTAFIADPVSGVLRPASPDELREYVYGGEYDERLEQIGEEDDWLDGMD